MVSDGEELSAAHRIEVALAARSYPVLIGAGLLPQAGAVCAEIIAGHRCAIISDETVAALYAAPLVGSLASAGVVATLISVPSGESSKSLSCAAHVCDQMIAAGLDRSSFVVALGGGVVGDLAGFCAAIYYRGIPVVQVPTTIVSQVDSSVGGKTGVNTAGGKNLLGCFHQPMLVLADVNTLATLPSREFNEGMAEVIKHAVIRDASMFDSSARLDRADGVALAALVARNVAIKAAIVSNDEFETKGERALLNFGHTIGHGVENAAGYGRYLHGEAISLGMVAAGRLSMELAGLPPADYERILSALRRFGLPESLPADISTESILRALRMDKKFAAGQVRFVLTPRLGEAFVSREVTLAQIEGAIEGLRG